MIKVHLAISTDILAAGLRTILSNSQNIEVRGRTDGRNALKAFLAIYKIDVLFIDYHSSQFTSDDIFSLKEVYPELRIIAITHSTDVSVVKLLMQSGLSGHLLHDCDVNEILQGVEECVKGQKFYCGQILDKINESNHEISAIGCDAVVISERELEVINHIAQGLTTKEIAEHLHLSVHTIMTHRKNIMGKLGLKNAAGLITYAVKEKLISPEKFLFS